jgi:hypothetical protein
MKAYPDYLRIPDETWEFAASGSSAPDQACLIICCSVDGPEGDLVGLEDGLESGGGGYNVGGAGGEGCVEIEGGVIGVGQRCRHDGEDTR